MDALAGPAAEAAFRLLAENTETYLGRDFANDRALGAVTSALFESIQQTTQESNIVDVFSEQGLIRLYQAGLGVVEAEADGRVPCSVALRQRCKQTPVSKGPSARPWPLWQWKRWDATPRRS